MPLPEASVVLNDQLCFSPYRASRAITARYRPMLDRMGIAYPQLLALMALWEDDDLTVRELSDRVDLDGGTVSPILKRLAGLGLVTRERSTQDERLVRIRLTEAGRTLQQPAQRVSATMIDSFALDAPRFTALKQDLDDLAERMTSHT